MSRGPVIEEAFARMLLHESIFDDTHLTASLSRITSLKDIRVVSRHCVYRTNSDEDCRTFDDEDSDICPLQKSLSENGILLKKRLLRSGFLSQYRRRKSVTFADSKGRDLVQVREFDNNIDPIQNCLSRRRKSNPPVFCPKYIAMFCQPCANYSEFMRQLCTKKVCLENAQIISEDAIIGTVKVQNLSYEKHVTIRYTIDSWKTYHDFDAKFLHCESADIDIFTFRMAIPKGVASMEFCIRFSCNSIDYWDNNNDLNYCVKARELPKDGGQIK